MVGSQSLLGVSHLLKAVIEFEYVVHRIFSKEFKDTVQQVALVDLSLVEINRVAVSISIPK